MDYIRFLGHSGFEINLHDTVILIDPFFGNGLKQPCRIPTINSDLVKRADLILLTHEHAPHTDLNAVKEISERTGATIVGPNFALRNIDINVRQKVEVKVGDGFQLKGIDLTIVKASHPQSQYPVGFIINDYVKIYHAGDTYIYTDMSKLEVDYALIPIGGQSTMDILDAANATKMFRAKYIIPMHYNTYERIRQDVSDFTRRVTRGKVLVLDPDQSIQIQK